MTDNTTFNYHGDRAGSTGTFDFEVEIGGPVTPDADFILIGHGDGSKLTLTGVSRWDAQAEDWVDGTLDQAPANWQTLVREAQDAHDEAAYDRAHP